MLDDDVLSIWTSESSSSSSDEDDDDSTGEMIEVIQRVNKLLLVAQLKYRFLNK